VIPRALLGHFLLTLQLNFRSKQALVYGYFVPFFFLIAFGSVFHSERPLLLHQMGQLLTLTALGGACFGLPTGIVAERERGVWRRYQLLPVGTLSLLLSTLLARVVIVTSAAFLQVALARAIYGTPWPLHPGETALAFLVVTGAFLGLGLLIASLADDVPAVQALGQCLFLPMIMIGGVGVPLGLLPAWAQQIAGFMPGRYAVELLQLSISEPRGLGHSSFAFLALAVIGLAAAVVGVKLFRWDGARRLGRAGMAWVATALLAWIAVGAAAAATGNLRSRLLAGTGYEAITPEQIASIRYDDLPGDDELYTRLAPPFKTPERPGRLGEIATRFKTWPPGQVDDPEQRARNLLSIAAIADVNQDLLEGEIARVVFDQLQENFSSDELKKILAHIALAPNDGKVITQAREFGLKREILEKAVRERSMYYAKKLLGRLVGKIAE